MSPEDSEGEKFGIALPSGVLKEVDARARKLGMSRSAYIRDVLSSSISQAEEGEHRVADDDRVVRRLIADSEGLGFDMESACASKAVKRDLTGEEWDPEKHPNRLRLVLERQRKNDDFWGDGQDRRHDRINRFADKVGVDRKTVKQAAKEAGYIL